MARAKGLWVVLTKPPAAFAELIAFVELEDEQGRGVGPTGGVSWQQEGEHWLLGPFRAPETDQGPGPGMERDEWDQPPARERASETLGAMQEAVALLRGALGSPDLNLTRERLTGLVERLSGLVGQL